MEFSQQPTEKELLTLHSYLREDGIKTVASKMQVSEKAIEYRLKSLRQKLGLVTLKDLVCWSFRSGFTY